MGSRFRFKYPIIHPTNTLLNLFFYIFRLYLLLYSGWWNKSEFLKKELFTAFKENDLNSSIYLAYGSSESKVISKSKIEMDDILNGLEIEKLEYQFNIYQKENHNSILSRGIYDGLLYTHGH